MKKKLVCFLSVVLTVWLLLPQGAFAASFQIDFDTACDALQLVNLDTGTVVYEKNADKRREPASTTKIMTYIVVYENVEDPDNTTVTISEKIRDELLGTGSSLSGIEVGDVLTVKQLLYCMMIPSGNDAALALADFVGGGDVQKFVDMMNEKAAELGCTNTHFMNPHGLHDDEHYTTARDLAIITQYAMMLPDFMDITDTTNIYYKPYGGPDAEEKRLLVTTNRLIHKNLDPQYYYQYAQGIKTGSHDQAGYCLVSTATKNGMSYLCVALGAPSVDESGNRISEHGECTDSMNLYEWAFGNLGFRTLAATEDAVTGELYHHFPGRYLLEQYSGHAEHSRLHRGSREKGRRDRHGHLQLRRSNACHHQPGRGRERRAKRTAQKRKHCKGYCHLHMVSGHRGRDSFPGCHLYYSRAHL